MIRGLYSAASGIKAQATRTDIHASNLANVSTSGFRSQRAFASVYRGAVARAGGPAASANQAVALAGSYE